MLQHQHHRQPTGPTRYCAVHRSARGGRCCDELRSNTQWVQEFAVSAYSSSFLSSAVFAHYFLLATLAAASSPPSLPLLVLSHYSDERVAVSFGASGRASRAVATPRGGGATYERRAAPAARRHHRQPRYDPLGVSEPPGQVYPRAEGTTAVYHRPILRAPLRSRRRAPLRDALCAVRLWAWPRLG